MRKSLYLSLALAIGLVMGLPAWAQKGTHGKSATHSKASAYQSSHSAARSNKGGQTRGIARAEQVQQMNTKADAERGFTAAPGLATASNAKSGTQPKGKSKPNTNAAGKDEDKD
jgi:hypothetical protein